MGAVASVCHPSILRITICAEASSAQNSMAAVSAEGSTVWGIFLMYVSYFLRSQVPANAIFAS